MPPLGAGASGHTNRDGVRESKRTVSERAHWCRGAHQRTSGARSACNNEL